VRNADKLESVFEDVMSQVTAGKGAERHGFDQDFLDQPWKWIAEGFGEGFLLGQAVKKAHEATKARDWTHDRWEREMLGAIAYLGFAIVRRRMEEEELRRREASISVEFDPGLPGAGKGGAW
jgi:hypothetical protein